MRGGDWEREGTRLRWQGRSEGWALGSARGSQLKRNGVQKWVRAREEAGARKAGTGTRKEGYQVLREREVPGQLGMGSKGQRRRTEPSGERTSMRKRGVLSERAREG